MVVSRPRQLSAILVDELNRIRRELLRLFRRAVQPNDSGQFVRPSSIHSNPFDITNANQLKAHIIAAISLIGKLHQLLRRSLQVSLSR